MTDLFHPTQAMEYRIATMTMTMAMTKKCEQAWKDVMMTSWEA